MKIISIHELLKQDIGTLFVKVDVQCDGQFMQLDTDIMMFGGQIGDAIDFGYNNLLEVDTSDADSIVCSLATSEVLIQANESKKSFKLDFDCGSRDGCHDYNQLFAVFEQADIDQLFDHIKPFSSKEEHIFMSLDDAKATWNTRSNGLGYFINPSRKVTNIDMPLWSESKGGRVWLEGELCLDELEAMVVMGRAQLKEMEEDIYPKAGNPILARFDAHGWSVTVSSVEGKGFVCRKHKAGDHPKEDEVSDFFPMVQYANDIFNYHVASIIGAQLPE